MDVFRRGRNPVKELFENICPFLFYPRGCFRHTQHVHINSIETPPHTLVSADSFKAYLSHLEEGHPSEERVGAGLVLGADPL